MQDCGIGCGAGSGRRAPESGLRNLNPRFRVLTECQRLRGSGADTVVRGTRVKALSSLGSGCRQAAAGEPVPAPGPPREPNRQLIIILRTAVLAAPVLD